MDELPGLLAGLRAPDVRLSRRRFLQVSAAAAVLAACDAQPTSSPPVPTPTTPVPSGAASPTTGSEPPFSVWRLLRERLRTSPDHLAARADSLVAARNPEAIARFVAEEIATLPGQAAAMGNAETAVRWGTRATLRCGAGTPREKAELLAELLTAAGAPAQVMTTQLRADLAGTAELLFRPVERAFMPDVDGATLDEWRRMLGLTGPAAPLKTIDTGGADSRALAGALGGLLPSPRAAAFDRAVTSRIPVVVATIDGAETIFNPLVADDPIGSQTVTGSPVVASPASSPTSVRLEVLVARSDDPNTRVVVADATWTADALVGRLVQVAFSPVGGITGLVGRSIEEVTLFTPVLAVHGADLAPEAATELAFAGKTISTGGRILEDHADGTPMVDGLPLATGPTNPAGAAAVVSVAAQVRADAFPTVRVSLSPADSGGEIVAGLGAADLQVEEDGRPVAFTVVGNQPRPPRVLLLFDASRSIPAAFRGREAAGLGRQLAEGVAAAQPGTEFLVAGVNYGTVTPSGSWTGDPAIVEQNVASVPGEGSDLWMALGEATTQGASAIVLITDGEPSDPPEEVVRARPRIAGGPPVLVVGVGGTPTPATDAFAALSGGAYLPVTAVPQAVQGVVTALAEVRRSPYRLEFVTRRDGPATRTVRVAVGGASTQLQYEVPSPAERVPATALAGIYLRLRVGGQGEVMRTLAGLDHLQSHRQGDIVPEAITDDVLGALFGGTLIAVEAGAPTFAAWLDSRLAAELSIEPLWAAARARDVGAMLDALGHVKPVPPAVLQPLTAQLPSAVDSSTLTFPSGLRCVLWTEAPVFGIGIRQAVDILPTAEWVTAGGDRAAAHRLTLERTARLAVGESAVFEISTSSILAGRPLRLLPAGQVAPRDGAFASYARHLDEYSAEDRLVPDDAGAFAFWVVRAATGELLGILSDGSGGGQEVQGSHIIDKTAAALGLFVSSAKLGFAVGAFIALQKAIAKVTLVLAAWILTIGDENAKDPDLTGNLTDLACDLAKETLSAAVPGYSVIDDLDKVGEIAGKGLVPCP